jgi:hypothetical protein
MFQTYICLLAFGTIKTCNLILPVSANITKNGWFYPTDIYETPQGF